MKGNSLNIIIKVILIIVLPIFIYWQLIELSNYLITHTYKNIEFFVPHTWSLGGIVFTYFCIISYANIGTYLNNKRNSTIITKNIPKRHLICAGVMTFILMLNTFMTSIVFTSDKIYYSSWHTLYTTKTYSYDDIEKLTFNSHYIKGQGDKLDMTFYMDNIFIDITNSKEEELMNSENKDLNVCKDIYNFIRNKYPQIKVCNDVKSQSEVCKQVTYIIGTNK